jgi:Holliday junction resolvasome RuvABC endonuclease subunit
MKAEEAILKSKIKKQRVLDFLSENMIISIDPAELTGWASSDGDYGTWNCKLKRDETFGYKLIKFENYIDELVQFKKRQKNIIISYERPSGVHANAVISHSKLVGVIELYCIKQKIEHRGYSAKEIKKFATGNGNAGKPMMIQAAIEKFNYKGNEDNEADAICLLNFTINDLI